MFPWPKKKNTYIYIYKKSRYRLLYLQNIYYSVITLLLDGFGTIIYKS